MPVYFPNLSGATRWGLNLLLLLSVVVALYLGQSVFIPMIIALLLAAMLWPAAARLHGGVPIVGLTRHPGGFPWVRPCLVTVRVPWALACTLMVAALIVIIATVPIGFGLSFSRMVQAIPRDSDRQTALYNDFRNRLETVSTKELVDYYVDKNKENFWLFQAVKNLLDPANPSFLAVLQAVGLYGGNWVWQWVLITFLLLFFLLEGKMLSRRVAEIFGPASETQEKAVKALESMAEQVRIYLVWRTIVNFGLAAVLGVFYYAMGLAHPWSWALLTAILCYIPYLGQIAAGVPPVLDAFLNCSSPWFAVVVLAFYVVVMIIEGYLIVPVVMGRPMQLNATTVILACLFWHLVWGTPGLFLAMPLMAALKAICAHVPGWEAWANLMSTRDPDDKPPPREEPPPAPPEVHLSETEVMTISELMARRAAREATAKKKEEGSR